MMYNHRLSDGTSGGKESKIKKPAAHRLQRFTIWTIIYYEFKGLKQENTTIGNKNENRRIPQLSCLSCLWELTNIWSSSSSGLRATRNHKSPLRWKKSAHWKLPWSPAPNVTDNEYSITTPKFLKRARRKASQHNSRGRTRQLARWAGAEKEHFFHLRPCKNPSLVSDCLILHYVSDSNMGFILYNYPSHGNDCISSFRTDNSIWTQVIRFLGCGWYLSIICPVKR